MKLWEILVPCEMMNPHTGRTKINTVRFHKIWDKRVEAITGGLTILRPAKGIWAAPTGEVITERMIPVRLRATDEQMEQIADLTLEYYNQDAVFYYVISNDSRIKFRVDKSPKID